MPLKSRKILVFVLIFIVLAAVGASLFYYFNQRTPDSTYDTVNVTVKKISASSTEIDDVLSGITSAVSITNDDVTKLNEAQTNYSAATISLNDEVSKSTDSKLKSLYNQNVTTLKTYDSAAVSNISSIDKYLNILDECALLTDRTKAAATIDEFNQIAASCIDAITAAQSSTESAFSDQFLNEYAKLSSDLITSYRSRIQKNSTALTNSINSTRSAMNELGNKKLDLSIKDVSQALQKITDTAAEQKKALLR